jgi:octopine/nopaline transport system permease protein
MLAIEGLDGWIYMMLRAATVTVALVVVAFPVALALGALVCRWQLSASSGIALLGRGYSIVLRGIPELLVIYLVFFGGSKAASSVAALFGVSGGLELSSFASGVAAVVVIGAAYIAESLRGAYQAVSRGQFEAATAFGMPFFVKLRRVTAPLVLASALPSLGNNFILVIKLTSLVSVTGLVEVMRQAQIGAGSTRQPFVFYAIAAFIFLLLIGCAQLMFALAERYLKKDRR